MKLDCFRNCPWLSEKCIVNVNFTYRCFWIFYICALMSLEELYRNSATYLVNL